MRSTRQPSLQSRFNRLGDCTSTKPGTRTDIRFRDRNEYSADCKATIVTLALLAYDLSTLFRSKLARVADADGIYRSKRRVIQKRLIGAQPSNVSFVCLATCMDRARI